MVNNIKFINFCNWHQGMQLYLRTLIGTNQETFGHPEYPDNWNIHTIHTRFRLSWALFAERRNDTSMHISVPPRSCAVQSTLR